MNKYLSIFFLCITFISCSNSSSPDETDKQDMPVDLTLKKIQLSSNCKSIFLSRVTSEINLNARDVTEGWNTLFEVLDDGIGQEVFFENSSGEQISLLVTKLIPIGIDLFGIYFDAAKIATDPESVEYYIGKKAIIQISTGNVYDMSEYDLSISTAYKDKFYFVTGQTLYHVDTSIFSSAIPMNNPSYFPAYAYTDTPLLVSDTFDVIINSTVFFYDSSIFPKYTRMEPNDVFIGESLDNTHNVPLWPLLYMHDESGVLYAIAHNYSYGSSVSKNADNVKIVWAKMKTDSSNTSSGVVFSDHKQLILPLTYDDMMFSDFAIEKKYDLKSETKVAILPHGFLTGC